MLLLINYCCFPVIDLSLDVIVDLAHHPNIIGIKESGGDVSDCSFSLMVICFLFVVVMILSL